MEVLAARVATDLGTMNFGRPPQTSAVACNRTDTPVVLSVRLYDEVVERLDRIRPVPDAVESLASWIADARI
nr:hypothetical protein [Streptomyces geranii]